MSQFTKLINSTQYPPHSELKKQIIYLIGAQKANLCIKQKTQSLIQFGFTVYRLW